MEKQKRTFRQYMRLWHRNLGYLVAGLCVVYALSGIILIFRDTNLLKVKNTVSATLDPNLPADAIASALKLKNFKVIEESDSLVTFSDNGVYHKTTGAVQYTRSELRTPFNKLTTLHKMPSKGSPIHWFSVVFGVIFCFLAVSSLWMFKPGTQIFKHGMIYVGIGVVAALLLVIFL